MAYILVDYSNLIHRSKHGIRGDASLKSGMAMHIALNSFRKLWREFDGSHIIVCLDGGSWRKEIYPRYKQNRKIKEAQRSPKEVREDEQYFAAMDSFAEFLREKTNVTVIREPGIEADDVIARWIQLHPDHKNIIFSGDTDFYQLLSENVSIYDGVKDHIISIDSVKDGKGKPVVNRRAVRKKVDGKTKVVKVTEPIQPPVPEYELFKKIIRGDSSDNIMPAYPGVREAGSSKKPGILEAFNDRETKGYDWNAFMLTEWDKSEMGDDGLPVSHRVRVIDEFKINELLIDLSKQPSDVIARIDQAIVREIQQDKVSNVGISFMRFCNKHDLVNIGRNPTEYAQILNTAYS